MKITMMKRKNAFFFTMAAIVMAIVIMMSFSVYESGRLREKSDVVLARVQTVNDFVKDVEIDLQKGITITTARTLLGIQEYMTEEGMYLGSAPTVFEEGFLQGTIESTSVNLLTNATFPDWIEKIQEQAEKIDINATFAVLDMEVTHTDPWTLNVSVVVEMNVSDKRKTAQWSRQKQVSSKISVLGLEDPVYIVHTGGRVTNTIRQTNATPFVVGSSVSNLMAHTNGSFYFASNLSPSYLLRLEGSFNSSPFGMESLVNVPKLQANNVPIFDRSVVDVVYFGPQSTTNHRINGTPSWFKIDVEHLDTYGVAGLIT
jgi:hypothetical protein